MLPIVPQTRPPATDQTAASRKSLDLFLTKTKAQLWIQHDFVGTAKLKKAPQYYD